MNYEKYVTFFLLGIHLSCVGAKEKLTQTNEDFLLLDSGISWVQKQELDVCQESINLLSIISTEEGNLRIIAVGGDVTDRVRLLDKTVRPNELLGNIAFKCFDGQPPKKSDYVEPKVVNEIIERIIFHWNDPECRSKAYDYIVQTNVLFPDVKMAGQLKVWR